MKLEQEPVAYLSNKRQRINIEIKPQTFVDISTVTEWEMPLYMKPPQRTWVGLTAKEANALQLKYQGQSISLSAAVENLLREKNNGQEESL